MRIEYAFVLAVLVIALIALVASVASRRLRLRHMQDRYIGFGWCLGFRYGAVIVVARVPESPSEKARVHIGAKLLEYDGVPMQFATVEEFVAYMEKARPKRIGHTSRFKIDNTDMLIEVTMAAAMTYDPVPVYGPPEMLADEDRVHIYHGIATCPSGTMH